MKDYKERKETELLDELTGEADRKAQEQLDIDAAELAELMKRASKQKPIIIRK